MSLRLIRFVAMVMLVAVVAACSGNKGDSGASTGDTMGDGTSVGDGSATTIGTGTDGGLTPEEMRMRGEQGGLQYVFYFDFDQSQLSPEIRAALDAQAAVLRNSNAPVRIEGHADERGTREYNLALGERRGKAVAQYLILQGVDRSRVETISYGEERPAALGEDEASWSRNRRVELK